MLRGHNRVSILPHYLPYERLCKGHQGAAAAAQTNLISLFLLLVVRDGQPGQLLLQNRQSQAQTSPLSVFQTEQHWARQEAAVSITVQQREPAQFYSLVDEGAVLPVWRGGITAKTVSEMSPGPVSSTNSSKLWRSSFGLQVWTTEPQLSLTSEKAGMEYGWIFCTYPRQICDGSLAVIKVFVFCNDFTQKRCQEDTTHGLHNRLSEQERNVKRHHWAAEHRRCWRVPGLSFYICAHCMQQLQFHTYLVSEPIKAVTECEQTE